MVRPYRWLPDGAESDFQKKERGMTKRCGEERMIGFLKAADAGMPGVELAARMGMEAVAKEKNQHRER